MADANPRWGAPRIHEAFRTRALTTEYPYIWVDATYHKVRVDERVTSQATVVAVGVTSDGERQVAEGRP